MAPQVPKKERIRDFWVAVGLSLFAALDKADAAAF